MSFVITSSSLPTPIMTGDVARLRILLDSSYIDAADHYQEYVPRLLVDGTEIRIRSCSWDKSQGNLGIDCGFTLADINDRNLITSESSLTFHVGIKKNGVINWGDPIAALQKLSQRAFDVSGDGFTFKSISGVTDQLTRAAVVPLFIYDPNKVTYDAETQERLYDTEGRVYTKEAIEVPGLTLSYILNYVFVTKCGFSSVWTDMGDFPIPQFEVGLGESLVAALSPLIEPFSMVGESGPLIVEVDDQIRIYDTSISESAGFPAPRDLSIFGCSSLALDASFTDVGAMILNFTSPDTWDYATLRVTVQSNIPVGPYLYKSHEEWTFELRSYFQPEIIMDERTWIIIDKTQNSAARYVSQELSFFIYDRLARQSQSTVRRWTERRAENGDLIPIDIGQPADEDETQYTFYAPHPTKKNRHYQSKTYSVINGEVMVDENNPYLGSAFRQSARQAHIAGNINDGVTYEQHQLLRTRSEEVRPRANGQITRNIIDYDHVRDAHNQLSRDPQVADVSLNGANSKTRTIIVTADGNVYTGGPVASSSTGPIPLHLAVPLQRRRLLKMKTPYKQATLDIIGVNRRVVAGLKFSVSDKNRDLAGKYICVGYSGQGSNLGTAEAQWSMSVEGLAL